MKIKSQKDFWSGLMFIVVGLGFALGAMEYSFGSSARPGPGYFPFGLGLLQAVLGAAVLFKSLTVDTADGEPLGAIVWRPLIIIPVAVALFGFLLPRVGLVVTLPVTIIVACLAGDEFSWKDAIISAVVLTVASWLIFVVGLKLVIPVLPAFMTVTGA
ncbi:MAG: hypothetical protein RLY78_774 [Pseudomonadota bacterium]|jgi:hypothetical protein